MSDSVNSNCCPSRSLGQGTPGASSQGEIIELDSLPLYISGKPCDRAVIVVYDIYGFNGGRIREICDQIASEGYFVVMPDFFRGDAWNDDPLLCDISTKMDWIKSISVPAGVETDLMDRVFPFLTEKGASKVGVVGFCFGGYAAWIASKQSNVACAVGIHSAVKLFGMHGSSALEEVPKLKCPQMMLQAGNDPEDTKPNGDIQKALMENNTAIGKDCVFEEFPNMKHGWVPRGDISDPETLQCVQEAMQHTLDFLRTHLGGAN